MILRMKTKKNTFPQQTHFIGVLVPEDLTLTLEDCRRYMGEKYGCKSGYGTPIHVTLVPPFCAPDSHATEDIVSAIEKSVLPFSDTLKFTARVENFDAFGDRTIFANVVSDEKWTRLRDKILDSVSSVFPHCARKEQRPFRPHLTVANRDIPAGVSKEALSVLNEMDVVEDFAVDNVTVFERRGGKWVAAWVGGLGADS